MSTVFATGTVATGGQFLGRKKDVEKIIRFFYEEHKNVAVVGLPRIGKTSIAERVCEKMAESIALKEEKAVILMRDLASETSFESYWQSIILHLYETLQEKGLTHRVLDREYEYFEQAADSLPYNLLKPHAERFLSRLKKMGIQVFLIIDEFDAAVEKFHRERYYYEFFRDIASSNDYSVRILLVSRQLIKQIEANAYGNSTLFGIFDDVSIRPFNQEDMQEYDRCMKENGCPLSDEMHQRLDYYAGHNPYLLAILGDRLLDASSTAPSASVDAIYKKICPKFFEYFEALMHQMDRDDNLVHIQEIIIGPRYTITKTDIDTLESMGYLSHRQITNSQGGKEEVWEVVSELFAGYMRLNSFKPVWTELSEAHMLLMKLLHEYLPKLYGFPKRPSYSPLEFNRFLEEAGSALCTPVYRNFIKKNKRCYDRDTTFVDVARISALAQEFKRFWDNSEYGFRDVFGGESYAAWNDCFVRLEDSRNACAHDHPDFLSEDDIKETNRCCQRVKKALDSET